MGTNKYLEENLMGAFLIVKRRLDIALHYIFTPPLSFKTLYSKTT